MSSLFREPLSGLIRQDRKVVGAICLPEEELLEFIEQFNDCYGPMRMTIEEPEFLVPPRSAGLPVGAHRRSSVFAPVLRKTQTPTLEERD